MNEYENFFLIKNIFKYFLNIGIGENIFGDKKSWTCDNIKYWIYKVFVQ